ncbi:hypothetical protein BY458DRAFT_504603 [Sporodiniella umbellata]|nr:hypothetical protein BY458DRAFT_504603 [Sporodiniella umbellata]
MSVNHWQDPNGPRYGNAYEDNVQHNAWAESNKTEQEVPIQAPSPAQNAYQYSGTPYGNPQQTNNAYTATTATAQETPVAQHAPPKQSIESNTPVAFREPTQWWFWLRFVTFLASIGHLGFAAGARPYSKENVPFSSSACFYYLFAVVSLYKQKRESSPLTVFFYT